MDARVTWNAERTEQLTKLWNDGLSCSRIAVEMGGGATRNSVIGKVSRLGLPGRITLHAKAQRYRSGPVSYEEKQRREAERYAQRAIKLQQRRKRAANKTLPPLHIIEKPAPQEFLGLTFDQLDRKQCRYPRGEDADLRFCGQPVAIGSYCGHCYRICHTKTQPSERLPFAHQNWRAA